MKSSTTIIFVKNGKMGVYSTSENPFLSVEIEEGEEAYPRAAVNAANSVLRNKIYKNSLQYIGRLDGCNGFKSSFVYTVNVKVETEFKKSREPAWVNVVDVETSHVGLNFLLKNYGKL